MKKQNYIYESALDSTMSGQPQGTHYTMKEYEIAKALCATFHNGIDPFLPENKEFAKTGPGKRTYKRYLRMARYALFVASEYDRERIEHLRANTRVIPLNPIRGALHGSN